MAALCIALFPSLSHAGMFAPHILLWEAFVSLALLGYGLAALRALRLRAQPIAVSACTGVAVWVLLGGWLNLANLASRRVLLLLLAFGFLMGVVQLAQSEMRDRISARLHSLSVNNLARNAAIPIAIYLLLVFAVHLRPIASNKYDDQQGYMAFADKTAQFSTMQSDPFSERRVSSGLGGGIFLNVTMLAGADASAMGYIDAGFGYLVFILSVWSVGRALGLTGWRATALLYFVPVFSLAKVNLTIVNLSAALPLAMLLLLMRVDWRSSLPPRVAVVLGVLLGAGCAMKSSNIPFCGALLAVCGIGFALHALDWRRLLPFLFPVAGLTVVVLPWMVRLHRDEGTYFFPTLGRGYHVSAYNLLPLPSQAAPAWQSLLIAAPELILLSIVCGLSYFLLRDRPAALRIPTLSFAGSALASVILIAISVAGESIDRYTAPFCTPCLLLLVVLTLLGWRNGRQLICCVLAIVFLLACGVFFDQALSKREFLYDDFDQLRSLTSVYHHRLEPYAVALDAGTIERNEKVIRRAQDAVPPGQTILESTETAYGYNWLRNPVYIADYPGMAGPPPGPPIFGEAESMRSYLLQCGIHYVIYDRILYIPLDFENFAKQPPALVTRSRMLSVMQRIDAPIPWSLMEYYTEQHTRLQFQQIAKHHPVIYDDGRIEVIRLDL